MDFLDFLKTLILTATSIKFLLAGVVFAVFRNHAAKHKQMLILFKWVF